MYAYRLTSAVNAIAREGRQVKVIYLEEGTIVRMRKAGSILSQSEVVEVVVDGEDMWIFTQDLELHGKLVDANV